MGEKNAFYSTDVLFLFFLQIFFYVCRSDTILHPKAVPFTGFRSVTKRRLVSTLRQEKSSKGSLRINTTMVIVPVPYSQAFIKLF